ncbi:hypothetical protein T02_3636 [Trichinella nativa]|uniref:Uncharacterized protein n=1 Tax=Trichinella nativa TaxID=6335 RepID=A0A0V1KXM9_9BILA|nr:hypothetical protein T02_3636 [Trichinella nativa]
MSPVGPILCERNVPCKQLQSQVEISACPTTVYIIENSTPASMPKSNKNENASSSIQIYTIVPI